MLTRDSIRQKAAAGPRAHVVFIRSWNDNVILRELDGLQMLEWDTAANERLKEPGRAIDLGSGAEHMVRMSLCEGQLDADGNPIPDSLKRMYGDTRADLQEVRNFGSALNHLYQHCLRINGLTRDDAEEVRKNSTTVLKSDTGSTSPTDGE